MTKNSKNPNSMCGLPEELAKSRRHKGHKRFIEATLRANAAVLESELGDTTVRGDSVVNDIVQETEVDIDIKTGRTVVNAVAKCLEQHYLGICQTADRCPGREKAEELISKMSLDQTIEPMAVETERAVSRIEIDLPDLLGSGNRWRTPLLDDAVTALMRGQKPLYSATINKGQAE